MGLFGTQKSSLIVQTENALVNDAPGLQILDPVETAILAKEAVAAIFIQREHSYAQRQHNLPFSVYQSKCAKIFAGCSS